MAEDLDGAAKNLLIMRAEWRAVREGWRVIRADQDGWTHEYMQRCRTLARRGPVICATLIGIGFPTLAIALAVAVLI